MNQTKRWVTINGSIHVGEHADILACEGDGFAWISIGQPGSVCDVALHLYGEAVDNLAQACQDLAMIRAKQEKAREDAKKESTNG